jgi:hypothetical protein
MTEVLHSRASDESGTLDIRARRRLPGGVDSNVRLTALAGRAVWMATLGADDLTQLLREQSVPRLERLGAIVDAHGRPSRAKVAA